VNSNGTPGLDARTIEALVQDLLTRRPAYTPEWTPADRGSGQALLQAFAHHLRALAERVNQAPTKLELAFLDMLGLSLLPAQAARAPVVFQPVARLGDSHVPARTRVGAQVPGQSDPLIFETERAIALAAARLAEIVTVWPGRDGYADHSASLLAAQPVTLFTPLQPLPHELYLAHDVQLALSGHATVELSIELAVSASAALNLAWEYWDGQVWRGFGAFQAMDQAGQSFDGTAGLTRSGVVRLVADCAMSARRVVNGIESCWIRARVSQPLLRSPGLVLPQIGRLSLRTVQQKDLWTRTVRTLDPAILPPDPNGKIGVRGSVMNEDGQPADATVFTIGGDFNHPESDSGHTQANGAYGPLHVPPNQTVEVVLGFPFPMARDPLPIGTTPLEYNLVVAPGARVEAAFADGAKLDVSSTFYPFGQQAQAGSTFYVASQEAFSKPGAELRWWIDLVSSTGNSWSLSKDMAFAWQYWNGRDWVTRETATIAALQADTLAFLTAPRTVPEDLSPTTVNGELGLWMRLVIKAGRFYREHNFGNNVTIQEPAGPALANLRLGYVYRSPLAAPQACLTHNDFAWQDRSDAVRFRGAAFDPFTPTTDLTPALYLGFDKPLPADLVSLYLDIVEDPARPAGPRLVWETWDGSRWNRLSVTDETQGLALPGIISVLWPSASFAAGPGAPVDVVQAQGAAIQVTDALAAARFAPGDQVAITQDDKEEVATVAAVRGTTLLLKTPLAQAYQRATVSQARLRRFGVPRTWLRGRLQDDGDPLSSQVRGIYLNAVWASQTQTYENEVLGSSSGEPGQVFFFRTTPVLPGQVVEVRELTGPRAAIELPLLQEELLRQGLGDDAIRTVMDRRTGQVSEVWVRWQEQPNLFFSGPGDRHYTLERSRGRLLMGDNQRGRVAPPGPDAILARSYQAGGGLIGNVPAEAVNQLLAGVPVQGVHNPRAAQGGADGEIIAAVLDRGPQVVRHRWQALTREDYEDLARNASPAVAMVRALPGIGPGGIPAPGWITLVVMPHSHDAQPQPSFELRRQVHAFVAARRPATLAGQIQVTGPSYFPVGVEAVLAPLPAAEPGSVLAAVLAALQAFLHPLRGGPTGRGWPFGRAVYLSDIAALLERTPGVDYVPTLNLLRDGAPRGEVLEIPADRIVVAGTLRVQLAGQEA
jgi:hypothetical protein